MASYECSTISFVSSLLLLLLLSSPLISTEVSAAKSGCYFDAIYNFGDSLSDTGNSARESPSGALTLSFPYGISINNATGRFSDGLLIIDYFARKLRLPLLPPYLDKNASFANGVNFAVSGATALDFSFLESNNITNLFTNNSLGVQLDWFRKHKRSLCSSKQECARLFRKSLFFLGEIGANDFNYALGSSKTIEEMKMRYTPLIVRKIISAAEELIGAGAVHLIIPGNLPFGCAPFILDIVNASDPSAFDQNGCLVGFNGLIQYYNTQLEDAIAKLRNQHPSVNMMYADYYNAFNKLYRKPDLYGFDRGNVSKSCCGVGGRYNFDLNRLCGTPEATVCPNPSRYIFWDGIHPTQQAYEIMTMELLHDDLIRPADGLRRFLCV